jgi:tRNA(Ile)-lysidine synthase
MASNFLNTQLSSLESVLLSQLESVDAEQFWIAFSGGVDSKVLLHAAVRLRELDFVEAISAIHVNHDLQAESATWQLACQQDCDNYRVELVVERLNLSADTNIEDKARQGRYHAFEKHLKPNHYLLMAHHQDDQAETLLYRLLRGCGLQGAGGMPLQRKLGQGHLLRPLLTMTRFEIERYADENQLSWIEDPSNQSIDFSRNYLRHKVLPKIQSKWPSYSQTLARFTQVAAEQSELLEVIAKDDLQKVQQEGEVKKIRSAFEQEFVTLPTQTLKELSLSRQKNLLYFWGRWQTQLSPSNREVEQVINQLEAAENKSICINFAGQLLRSFSQQLMLTPTYQPELLTQRVEWNSLNQNLSLSNGLKVTLKQTVSKGLRRPKSNEKVYVDFRRGGEVCLPEYRHKKAKLKIIYQELNIPPWQREWLPLIYYNQELVAVPGVFVCKRFLSQDNNNVIDFDLSLL